MYYLCYINKIIRNISFWDHINYFKYILHKFNYLIYLFNSKNLTAYVKY